MSDFFQTPRFQLPDDWSPVGIRCAVIPIPDDNQYFSMLIGLVDALKWSKNFAPDETRTGAATVSRTWQAALESRPIEVQNCMPYLLRQNPSNLCQMQQSTDGGETWTLAFDYSLCEGAITIPAPFPDSDTGASDAAANVIANIWKKLSELAIANCETSLEQYITDATAWMRQFDAAWSAPTALEGIYNQMCALTPEEQEAYTGNEIYCDQFEELVACANHDGLFDWLNCLSEMLFDWLNSTGGTIIDYLNQAAGGMSGNGIQQTAGFGGAGGGAGFIADCDLCGEWQQTFDFEVSDGGFEAYVSIAPLAEYEAGVGWKSVFNTGGFGFTDLQIYYDLPNTYITHVTFTYESDEEGDEGAMIYGGTFPLPYEPNAEQDYLRPVVGALGAGEFNKVIKTITICGNGDNPFV